MEFKPVKNEKIYMLVIGQIRTLIDSGKISSGDKLPPERELATALSVSRASVRQATSALAAMGIVEVRHGTGTYVVDAIDRASVLDSFSRLIANEQIAPNEIIETRKMIECFAARLCAERAAEGFVPYLEAIIDRNRQASAELDAKLLSAINREFHMAIAEGTANRGIVQVMREVFRMMKANMWPRLKGKTYSNERRVQSHLDHHVGIFEAIRDHDGPRAERQMRYHLDTIEHELETDIKEDRSNT